MLQQISITFMSGPRDGDTLTFDVPEGVDAVPLVLTIGRREDSDICLNYDSQASRLHAHLSYDGEDFWLSDQGSRNGTFIGDEQLEESGSKDIEPDTLFRVGRTWLRLDPMPSDITAPADPIIIEEDLEDDDNDEDD